MKFFLIAILILSAGLVHANRGDWNSGGGLALTDGMNPWFLENTKTVKYCVLIDNEHFGQSLEISKKKIREAFQYWKVTLASAPKMETDGYTFPLATQEFIEQDACDEETQITFQLGVLTEEQIAFMKKPKGYIGMAVRTEYDRKKLTGKGFIYISPISGELAPKIQLADRWRVGGGKMLKYVLAHEIGHVFGLTFSKHPLMDPKFGFLFSEVGDGIEDVDWDSVKMTSTKYFGVTKGNYTFCADDGRGFFGSGPHPFERFNSYQCLRAVVSEDVYFAPNRIEFYAAKAKGAKFEKFGHFHGSSSRGYIPMDGYLVLSGEQEIYPNLTKSNLRLIESRVWNGAGEFTFVDGTKYLMTSYFDNANLSFGVAYKGNGIGELSLDLGFLEIPLGKSEHGF